MLTSVSRELIGRSNPCTMYNQSYAKGTSRANGYEFVFAILRKIWNKLKEKFVLREMPITPNLVSSIIVNFEERLRVELQEPNSWRCFVHNSLVYYKIILAILFPHNMEIIRHVFGQNSPGDSTDISLPGLQESSCMASWRPSWLAIVDVFHTESGVVDLLWSCWGTLNLDLVSWRGHSITCLQSQGIDQRLTVFSQASPDISAAAVSDHLLWTLR